MTIHTLEVSSFSKETLVITKHDTQLRLRGDLRWDRFIYCNISLKTTGDNLMEALDEKSKDNRIRRVLRAPWKSASNVTAIHLFMFQSAEVVDKPMLAQNVKLWSQSELETMTQLGFSCKKIRESRSLLSVVGDIPACKMLSWMWWNGGKTPELTIWNTIQRMSE